MFTTSRATRIYPAKVLLFGLVFCVFLVAMISTAAMALCEGVLGTEGNLYFCAAGWSSSPPHSDITF